MDAEGADHYAKKRNQSEGNEWTDEWTDATKNIISGFALINRHCKLLAKYKDIPAYSLPISSWKTLSQFLDRMRYV